MTAPKYIAAVGSAYVADAKVWFAIVSSQRGGCYYFGPFKSEQDAAQATDKLNAALKLVNSLVARKETPNDIPNDSEAS